MSAFAESDVVELIFCMVCVVVSSTCSISTTVLRSTSSPLQIILSFAWVEVQPTINTSRMMRSLESGL